MHTHVLRILHAQTLCVASDPEHRTFPPFGSERLSSRHCSSNTRASIDEHLHLNQMSIQLTAAQLEKQAARRAAKLAKAENGLTAARPAPKLSPEEVERRRFLRRDWVSLPGAKQDQGRGRAKIVSWNVSLSSRRRNVPCADYSSWPRRLFVSNYKLAMKRGLTVGRELFPGSDCLRWGDRKHMLLAEMEYYSSADVLCFQVSRLACIGPDRVPRPVAHGSLVFHDTRPEEQD